LNLKGIPSPESNLELFEFGSKTSFFFLKSNPNPSEFTSKSKTASYPNTQNSPPTTSPLFQDIERMKSSAAVIAESLSEFGRCLRETELPNDVETTRRILDAQCSERDAIKVTVYKKIQ
jgi:hypothetical protein